MTPPRAGVAPEVLTALAAIAASSALSLGACDGELRFDEPEADAGRDASGAAPTGVGPCASRADCLLPGLRCDAASQTCVQCTENAHCAAPAPRCDPLLHRCVECASTDDCASPLTCDSSTRRCRQPCREGRELCPAATRCNEALRQCVECSESEHCRAADRGICDRGTGRCVACLTDAACAGRRCDVLAGACVECLSPADCPAERPLCDLGPGVCAARP